MNAGRGTMNLRLFIVPRPAFIVSSKAEDGVELQARGRAVERAEGRLAEDAEQAVRALGDDAGQRDRHARVGGVGRDEAVRADVRRLRDVGEVEGREDGVALDAQVRVAEERVAALDRS